MDFVCIGAPRSGTTWLYSRLSELPDFKMPAKKEIHYFDRSRHYPSPSHLSESSPIKRVANPKWLLKAVGDPLNTLVKGDFDTFKWKLNWYFGNYDDEWYLSLFESDKITGDITPAYSILEDSDIQKMARINPNVKIVYLLRNPIERTWSSYRKNYLRENRTLSEAEIIEMCNRDGIRRRAAYMDNLNRYLKYFEPHQILIGFYDAVVHNPQGLMEDIVSFLGGNSKNVAKYCNLGGRNNASPEEIVPEAIMNHMHGQFENDILQLAETFGSFSENWVLGKIDETKSNEHPPTIRVPEVLIH